MKTNNINLLLKDIKKLERESHIWIDDVINKVTQEVCELLEADLNNDELEKHNEACDVLVNIYSVAEELWLDLDFDRDNSLENPKTALELAILLWNWNSKIQWLRSRYSRDDVTIEDTQNITVEFINEILNYTKPNFSIEEVFEKNISKFSSRVLDYKKNINIKDFIDDYKDFPKGWINFKDISPILNSLEALRYVIMELVEKSSDSEVIVWLDSRWFLFWTIVAEVLQKPFVMLRKKWKLPWKTVTKDYWLEYWSDIIELQENSISKWQKVSIIDDLLATGWTAKAAAELVEELWWIVNNISFVISLDEDWLKKSEQRKQLEQYNCNSIVSYA